MAGMSVTFLISSYWWKKRGFQFHSTVQTLRLHVTLNALLTSLVTWATQPSVCLKPFKTPTINNTALNHWLQIIEQGKSKTSAFYHTESQLGKDHFFGVFLQVSTTNLHIPMDTQTQGLCNNTLSLLVWVPWKGAIWNIWVTVILSLSFLLPPILLLPYLPTISSSH